MRPKKTILLVDHDDRRRAERGFVLETHRYAVTPACSMVNGAALIVGGQRPDLLLVSDLVYLPSDLIELTRQHSPETRSFLLVDGGVNHHTSTADCCLPWQPLVQTLASIRILTARKRGPKKRIPVPTAVPTETRSAA